MTQTLLILKKCFCYKRVIFLHNYDPPKIIYFLEGEFNSNTRATPYLIYNVSKICNKCVRQVTVVFSLGFGGVRCAV